MNYLRMKLKALLDKCNYRQLEYIASTKTQYIDTGVIPKKTTKTVVEFLMESQGYDGVNNRGSILGAYGNSEDAFTMNFGQQPAPPDFFVWVDKSFKPGGATPYKFPATSIGVKHKLTVQSGSATLDSTTIKVATKTADHTENSIYMFGSNLYGTPSLCTQGTLRIYSCKIYEGSTLVRDYIPVEKNGQVGMYDKVTYTLYTNKGTGEFVKGNAV